LISLSSVIPESAQRLSGTHRRRGSGHAQRQGREHGSCQFSWWCDGRSDRAREDESYATAKEVARKALNRQLTDRTAGALYFHHRRVMPAWAAEYTKTVEIGGFSFYKPRGGDAR